MIVSSPTIRFSALALQVRESLRDATLDARILDHPMRQEIEEQQVGRGAAGVGLHTVTFGNCCTRTGLHRQAAASSPTGCKVLT